jgi:hypothetical protein
MFRRGTVEVAQPLWQRGLALACLLLTVFASSAQAVHKHGQWLPHHDTQVSSQAEGPQLPEEASCPLCVAMHSALPATAALPETVLLVQEPLLPVAVADAVPDLTWHFARFSRPPPVLRLS